MRYRRSLILLATAGISICIQATAHTRREPRVAPAPPDVTLGRPKVGGYDRIYPFLDGLFQDVATTKLNVLTLDPNGANASSLDAVLNSFQAGVSFSATAGAANAFSQQLNNAVASPFGAQSQLIGQQAQLIQASLGAQQQVTNANNLVQQLTASSPNSDQLAAAQQAATAAAANLAGINAQITNLSNQFKLLPAGPTGVTGASFTGPTGPTAPTGQTLTSPTLPTAFGATGPTGVSFPASKQMDNQVNLLWERLSRLVGTLARPDSIPGGYGIDLMEIDVGITPVNRKKQLLEVEYELGCQTGEAPRVLDLFPSASAVNLVDSKYRENRIGLAAVLSWFSVGINAAYNRDHLQMTQALGQSGYITGYGIGASGFGWLFGRNLGDDTITPGTRRVFALIAAPDTCGNFSVRARRSQWFHDGDDDHRVELLADGAQNWYDPKTGGLPAAAVQTAGQTVADAMTRLTYIPVDYDPANPTNTPAQVAVTMEQPVDPQQIVSINGAIVHRARDFFGRGVSGSTGAPAQGVLETSTALAPNSWLPTGQNSFVLTLDPSGYGGRFPDIVVTMPNGRTYSVSNAIGSCRSVEIRVAGRLFNCSASTAADLPALGYPAGTQSNLFLSRWQVSGQGERDRLLIVSAQDHAPVAAAAAGATPALQVVSGGPSPWSTQAAVFATWGNTMYRLRCDPLATRLSCQLPPGAKVSFDKQAVVDLWDPNHTGGRLKASQSTETCGGATCSPLVWQLGTPAWIQDRARAWSLTLRVDLINAPDGTSVTLVGGLTSPLDLDTRTCGPVTAEVCHVTFSVPQSRFSAVTDSMLLRFGDGSLASAALFNLRALTQPVVTGYSDDQKTITGQNLILTQLRVGDSGEPLDLDFSADGSEVRLKKDYPDTAKGYLYFIDATDAYQAFLVKPGVAPAAIYHTPPASPMAAAAAAQAKFRAVAPGAEPAVAEKGIAPPAPGILNAPPLRTGGDLQLMVSQ